MAAGVAAGCAAAAAAVAVGEKGYACVSGSATFVLAGGCIDPSGKTKGKTACRRAGRKEEGRDGGSGRTEWNVGRRRADLGLGRKQGMEEGREEGSAS